MKKNVKIFCLAMLTILIPVFSASAEGTWTTYTTEDGLADNGVSSITVDGDNIKWFGTEIGVSSFDGTTWTTRTIEDLRLSNSVYAIAVDTDDVKWFGEFGQGVWSFDGTTWKAYTTEDGLVNLHIWSIAVDAVNVKWFATSGGVSSFDIGAISVENSRYMPAVMDIRGNYPNPFNPSTTIQYALPEGKSFHVKLNVYDIRGALVRTLVNQVINPGIHSVVWDGIDQTGNEVSSGIYIYRIQAGKFSKTNKMLLMR